jgi:hypothetical protein
LRTAQSAQTPGISDTDLGHGPTSLDLSQFREGLQGRQDLHLGNRLIGIGLVEKGGEAEETHLETILNFGANPASLSRFFPGSRALIRGATRGKTHGSNCTDANFAKDTT